MGNNNGKIAIKIKTKNQHLSSVIYRANCTLERQKEMWKNIKMNITTQQKKLNQQDTCEVTSVTCLCVNF